MNGRNDRQDRRWLRCGRAAGLALALAIPGVAAPLHAQAADKCVTFRPSTVIAGQRVSTDVTYCADEYDTYALRGADGTPLPAWPKGETLEEAAGALGRYKETLVNYLRDSKITAEDLPAVKERCDREPDPGQAANFRVLCGDLMFRYDHLEEAQHYYLLYLQATLKAEPKTASEKGDWELLPRVAAAIELRRPRPDRKLLAALAQLARQRGDTGVTEWAFQ